MGMLESLARDLLPDRSTPATTIDTTHEKDNAGDLELDQDRVKERRVLIKKLRKTVLLGCATGLTIAFTLGAIFLAVFYTQANDLYGKSEEAWEGAFNLVAVLLITPMSLAILRADRDKKKWSKKLKNAFAGRLTEEAAQQDPAAGAAALIGVDPTAAKTTGTAVTRSPSDEKNLKTSTEGDDSEDDITTLNRSDSSKRVAPAQRPSFGRRVINAIKSPFLRANRGRTAIFTIPAVTTCREGLEGVVFIGGVSLGLPATSIPLPAVLGLAVGFGIGGLVFKLGSFTKVKFFLIASTCMLLIIAAGMASRAVFYLQMFQYIQKVGDAVAEGGDGPGSYDANNYIWHIDYANPEANSGGTGWGILNSLTGWNNTGTYGSILAYVFYWLFVIAYLVYSFWQENRLYIGWGNKKIWESGKARQKRLRREEKQQMATGENK